MNSDGNYSVFSTKHNRNLENNWIILIKIISILFHGAPSCFLEEFEKISKRNNLIFNLIIIIIYKMIQLMTVRDPKWIKFFADVI